MPTEHDDFGFVLLLRLLCDGGIVCSAELEVSARPWRDGLVGRVFGAFIVEGGEESGEEKERCARTQDTYLNWNSASAASELLNQGFWALAEEDLQLALSRPLFRSDLSPLVCPAAFPWLMGQQSKLPESRSALPVSVLPAAAVVDPTAAHELYERSVTMRSSLSNSTTYVTSALVVERASSTNGVRARTD